MHSIIKDLAPLDLAALDQRVRNVSEYRYGIDPQWQKLRPSDVSRLATSKFATSLVGLASFHKSGYVRETATQQLALQRTGEELPFLLIRLNDWVSEVREVATKAVRARLEPSMRSIFSRITNLCFDSAVAAE